MKVSKIIVTTMLMAFASFQVQAGALQDILSNGVLKAGTTGDWNPMTMKDAATNSYTGYDIDVMTALAADMGVELEIVPTEWKTLVAGVTAGKYHMTGSASISPSRAKAAGYSISYFSLATVPLTLKSNADKYKDWDDLNNADVRVAATLGTTQEKQVKQYFPNAKHVIVEAPAQPFQQVLSGRADAHITSNVEANKLVAIHSDLMIVPVSAPKSPTPIAMLLPQADQVWINYVNTWIKLKQERGFFDDLDVTELPGRDRHLAQVFQFPVLYQSMNVAQNLAFPLTTPVSYTHLRAHET